MEISPQCPLGWTFYQDFGGWERTNSCLQVSRATSSSWSSASTSCPPNSHLLSIRSSVTGSGLAAFAGNISSPGAFVGCYQEYLTSPISGWAWIDGTPATNLNCGLEGCGLWSPSAPRCGTPECECVRFCETVPTSVLSCTRVRLYVISTAATSTAKCLAPTLKTLLGV